MNTASVELPSPAQCIALMQAFWREQVQAEKLRGGLAVTLPLMYPDGWQVTLRIEPLTPGWARLSDAGRTLGTLLESGMSLDARHTAALLQDRLKAFEIGSDGAVLTKDVRLPLQGLDVQLFGEALVSIAHLIYRHEPNTQAENPAETAVQRVFQRRKVQPRRNVEIEGHLLRATRVDYLLEGRGLFALQVVNRRDHLLDYMERWAFRWTDLRKRNQRLRAGMVYDPENQDWDATSLRIGAEVCDVFCRYDEIAPLNQELDRVAG